jgi:Bacterial Ig-like domain
LSGNPEGISKEVTFIVDTAAPSITLNAPASWTNNRTPSFSGTTNERPPVTVHVYNAADTEVAKATAPEPGNSWSSGPAGPALSDGRYTAKATQVGISGHEGATALVSFTVDTVPPQLAVTEPSSGYSTSSESVPVKGTAGALPGDRSDVTVQLFSGATIGSQAPLQTNEVPVSNETWSTRFGGLKPGTYTVLAEQRDEAGNVGVSAHTIFSVNGPPSAAVTDPTGPAASFTWFPTTPHTGERVSLISSSNDAVSPITAYAWDLAGNGAFRAGGPFIGTSFSTPGKHLVRLRVTAADGTSSVAAETIEVTPPQAPLMRPFPIVRITGTRVASGVNLTLLSVQAPAGARIAVECTGHGCPVRSARRVAAASKRRVAPVAFHAFEHFLRAGVTLEIRVSKPGEVGKYTRYAVLRRKLPSRLDECLSPAGVRPMACPGS